LIWFVDSLFFKTDLLASLVKSFNDCLYLDCKPFFQTDLKTTYRNVLILSFEVILEDRLRSLWAFFQIGLKTSYFTSLLPFFDMLIEASLLSH
jgi:hypothetical protein